VNARARELVLSLRLEPHPEGGHYREVFRSPSAVRPADGRTLRSALTVIHFLLDGDANSRWHRVASDEVWHWVEGAPLELYQADPALSAYTRELLGPPGEGREPVRVVPAGHWQAARSTGGYTLVSCTVAPGFDFADFTLLADAPPDADALRRHFPDAAPLI
jgi:uncharacterized protein